MKREAKLLECVLSLGVVLELYIAERQLKQVSTNQNDTLKVMAL